MRMRSVMSIALALGGACACGSTAEPIRVGDLGRRYQIVGTLGKPLGAVVKVEGLVVQAPSKGYGSGGPNLQVQRIDGRVTQEDIQIMLKPYFHDWGAQAPEGEALPQLAIGGTYALEGYENGGYAGIPAGAWREAGIVFGAFPHRFYVHLVTYRAAPIDPVRFHPRDFADQPGVFRGEAVSADSQPIIRGDGWSIVADASTHWPVGVQGKEVEVIGTFAPLAGDERFAMTSGTWRLARLEDQVGRLVELRGEARSRNGHWWFRYRGTDLHVARMAELPGWSPQLHFQPIVVRGRLAKRDLPRIDQFTIKEPEDLAEQFIVDDATWESLDRLLAPERIDTANR